MLVPTKIISGGQTGVDQAALRAARDVGIPCGGWCPPGRTCENGLIPAEFPMQATPQDRAPDAPDVPRSLRTAWNVRDADATLVLRPAGPDDDPGTVWTLECAQRCGKPVMTCDPTETRARAAIEAWLEANRPAVLNVAGPSEETVPGIGQSAYTLLRGVLAPRFPESRE